MLAISQGLNNDAAAAGDCLRQALALLDRYGEEADTSGQLRGQVMAKLEEVNEVLAAAGGGGGAAPEDPMEADDDL